MMEGKRRALELVHDRGAATASLDDDLLGLHHVVVTIDGWTQHLYLPDRVSVRIRRSTSIPMPQPQGGRRNIEIGDHILLRLGARLADVQVSCRLDKLMMGSQGSSVTKSVVRSQAMSWGESWSICEPGFFEMSLLLVGRRT